MTVDSVEFRKIQYARELAAYTMRQWNLMRETLERERNLAASTVPHTQDHRPRSRSQPQSGSGMCFCFLCLWPVISHCFSNTVRFCTRQVLASLQTRSGRQQPLGFSPFRLCSFPTTHRISEVEFLTLLPPVASPGRPNIPIHLINYISRLYFHVLNI